MAMNLPLILSPSKDHPELVEGRGNLDEAEHTSTNRRCCGDQIANPRIEYGVAMTKWVRVRRQGLFRVVEINHLLVLSPSKDSCRWFDKLTMSGGRRILKRPW